MDLTQRVIKKLHVITSALKCGEDVIFLFSKLSHFEFQFYLPTGSPNTDPIKVEVYFIVIGLKKFQFEVIFQ